MYLHYKVFLRIYFLQVQDMNIGKYELNKIYCEDSYKAIKEIPDKSIDLIVTDPPYLIENTTAGGGVILPSLYNQ